MRAARTLLADLADCIGFFTRLPAPVPPSPDRAFAGALWAAPLAGLVVALVGGFVMMLAAALQLPPAICALLAVATTMIVTGALHEDGLADTADGLFGGYTRERRLEIMKDSRIGTFGAAALVFSIALRAAALAAIGLSWAAMLALVAAHMASRAVLPALLHATRPAKPEGLAASVGAVSRETAIVALAIGAVALLPLGILAAVQATFALALIFAAVRQAANQRIGGVTGDIVGALQQLCEIAALCAAAAAFT